MGTIWLKYKSNKLNSTNGCIIWVVSKIEIAKDYFNKVRKKYHLVLDNGSIMRDKTNTILSAYYHRGKYLKLNNLSQ